MEQLSQLPCISSLSALERAIMEFIDKEQNPVKVTINSCYRVNSAILAKAAVLKGLGFAILAEHCCLDAIKGRQIASYFLFLNSPHQLV
ncbi:hypothetical protein ACVXG7_13105 [Enterobacter hormaechei]